MGELIPCLTSLGSGYDVLNGLYADPASCKISVVDWNKGSFRDQRVGEITYRIPVSVSFHTVNRSSFYSVHGTSSTEYSKSLSIRTRLEGSYNFFSGSLSVDYSSNETSHLANEFTKIHHSCTLYTIILPSIPTFRELLSDEFARDINELTPGDLYRQYGTHIVNSLAVGGRASFTHATDSRKFSSDTSIDVAAQMSYKAIAGSITAEEEVMYRTAIATFRSSSSTKVLTKGGNPAYANDQFPNHIQEWTNSVINYPSFDDFGPTPTLMPVWELAPTEARRQILREALPIYLREHNQDLGIPPPYLAVGSANFVYRLASCDIEGNRGVHFDRPRLDDSRFFPGPRTAEGNPQNGLTVLERVPGALADVKDWEIVGTIMHHGTLTRFWRGIGPTRDYVLLCDFVLTYDSTIPDPTKPPAEMVKGLKVIHRSCLEPATYTNKRKVEGRGWPISVWDIGRSQYWKAGLEDNAPDSDAFVLKNSVIEGRAE